MQASLEKLCRNETFMNTVELQYLSGIEGEVDSFGLLINVIHTKLCQLIHQA